MSIAALRSATREAGSWRALRREFGVMLPVLLYHHVGPFRPGTDPNLTVSPQRFESHLRWLAEHGYGTIAPSDWLEWIKNGRELPENPVLITIDDAYADLAEFALPVLRRYRMSAAVYVVTRHIGGQNEWDRATGFGLQPLMTAPQIQYWAANGIEFGAHSRTHPRLTEISSDRLAEEVEGSALDLARLLGAKPISFAYPHGAWNEVVCEQVQRTFPLGLTCDPGLNCLSTAPHLTHRAEVTPSDSMLDFMLGVHLGRLPIQYLRVYFPRRVKSDIRRLLGRARGNS
jgi:peptidoglycan/xylan/chitin deacetylase (PgdA/CDA1 family)